MSEEEDALWQMTQYEGFEIHVAPLSKNQESDPPPASEAYTYVGYVCHPGANPKLPGHAVSFYAEGDIGFPSAQTALDEGMHVGRAVVDGTHPDLSVLSLVTSGV
ncbi:hypothetical protein LMG24076_02640 [Trinickia soli]|nr:hypothetical protein LMG24076_02640 [Trinickia soli]